MFKIKPKEQCKFSEPKFTGPYKIIQINKDKIAATIELVTDKKSKRKLKKYITAANFRHLYHPYRQ